jgi:hypothetical protein
MDPRDQYAAAERDFVPDLEELDGDERDTAAEMQLLLDRVQAARFCGA